MGPTQDDLKKLTSSQLEEIKVFLHRFPDGHEEFAKKHELGGGVVGYDAFVSPYAYVGPDASVAGNAHVEGCVVLMDHAYVCDQAKIVGCHHESIQGDQLDKIPNYALVLRGNAVVAENALIALKRWTSIHQPEEEELRWDLEALAKLSFGMEIEGKIDGLSFVLGAELKIGPEVLFTDSRLKGHHIELFGRKKFLEKDVKDQRRSPKDYDDFDPLEELMQEYTRLDAEKISNMLLRGKFSEKRFRELEKQIKNWGKRREKRFLARTQLKESLRVIPDNKTPKL